MKRIKSKVKMVPIYETEDFLENGKKAKPIGWMRDPDTTFGVVLDRATWDRLFGKTKKNVRT